MGIGLAWVCTWRWRGCAIALLALLLQACATGYQAHGLTGGYQEQKIAEDVYRVIFAGNGYASKEMVERYFMYRCAELTKEKGYKYFVVLRSGQTGARQLSPNLGAVPGMGDPWHKAGWWPAAGGADGFQQVRGSGGGYYYMPGGTTYVTTWTGRATIRMFKDVSLLTRMVGYVAEDVMRQLAPYIKDRRVAVDLPGPSLIDPVLGVMPLRPAPAPKDATDQAAPQDAVPKAGAPAGPEGPQPAKPDKAI